MNEQAYHEAVRRIQNDIQWNLMEDPQDTDWDVIADLAKQGREMDDLRGQD